MYNKVKLGYVGLKVHMGHSSGSLQQAVVYTDLKLRGSLGWRRI